jgi:hypothetical protein
MFCCGGKTWACDCGKRNPQPCQTLKATDVVFVGTVFRIDTRVSEEEGSTGSGETVYRFHIDQKISGTTGPEIDLYPGPSNDGCGYIFIEGEQYVVFAFQGNKGRLYTTICSGTRSIGSAQALLMQLRAIRDNRAIPSVFGVLRNAEQPFGAPSVKFPGEPLANTQVQLHSEDRAFESKTDANGIYAFYGVPAGEYHLTADLPANLELAHAFLDEPLEPLKLPEGACYEYNASAQATGRIRGSVLGPDGKPLSFADLDLFPVEKYPDWNFRWTEYQDQKKRRGFFEFHRVKPGDYILVFNDLDKISPDTPFPRFYYPGVRELAHAQRIHMEAGQQFLDADIHVSSGHPARDITVKLIAEEGNLPNIHYVEATGLDGSSPGEQELTLGVFTMSLFRDVRYTLHGEGYCSASGKESTTEPLEVDGSDFETKEIRLVFKGKGCEGPPKASHNEKP